MENEQLQQLKALALAATPGPWLHRHDPGNPAGCQHGVKLPGEFGTWIGDCLDNADCSTDGGVAGQRNAAFIAAANPAIVLAMIERIEEGDSGWARDAVEWLPLTSAGQIGKSDLVRFDLCGEKKVHEVALILNAGTDKEEIVYHRRNNWYLITSMSIKGEGSQKNVEFLPVTAALKRAAGSAT